MVGSLAVSSVSSVFNEIKVDAGLPQSTGSGKIEYPPEAFHMVTQLRWEDDVIWNGDEVRQKVLSKLNLRSNPAGWVPSTGSRTARSFCQQRSGVIRPELQIRLASMGKKLPENFDNTWYSIFPVDMRSLCMEGGRTRLFGTQRRCPRSCNPR